jgi:hypothetical protein
MNNVNNDKFITENINKDKDIDIDVNINNDENDEILIAPPSHFSKEETLRILLDQTPNSSSTSTKHVNFKPNYKKYSFTCGLVIRLKTLLYRIVKQRFQIAPPCFDGDSYMNRLYNIVNHFSIKIDNNIWTKEELWKTTINLSEKHSVLPPLLQKELCLKRVIMKDYPNDNSLFFDNEFLIKVANYYSVTKRPEGILNILYLSIYLTIYLTNYLCMYVCI